MKNLLTLIAAVFGLNGCNEQAQQNVYELNYDDIIMLDAEELAEQGINEAYEKIVPTLSTYIKHPAKIEEKIENDLPSYSVVSQETTYQIYNPSLVENEGQSWGRATYAVFEIINNQLKEKDVKFYALYGGNDLVGMFLTKEQYNGAIKSLERKSDWPYIPTLSHPWYGQNN